MPRAPSNYHLSTTVVLVEVYHRRPSSEGKLSPKERWEQDCFLPRMKELEQENAKLKRLVSELSLEKLVLKDIASGNVWSAPFLQAQVCF